MKMRIAVCWLVASVPAWTATPSYVTDNLSSVDSTKWSTAGSVIATRDGLTAPDANGGSLISRVPAPDGSADGEVRIKLSLAASGGSYTTFLRGSADARAGGPGGGSYLAFEMQNPTFTSGVCHANFAVFQSAAGTVSLLASFPHPCRNGMEMRMAVRSDVLLVWPDQEMPLEFAVDRMPQRLVAGQAGVGLRATPAGNAIAEVRLASAARNVPTVLDRQKAQVAAFPDHIDVQWAAAAATSSGADLLGYWIYRNGKYFGRTSKPLFQDETVTANSEYTYTIHAVDQHFNFSPPMSVTATAPSWPVVVPKFPGPGSAGGFRPRALAAEAPPQVGPSSGFDPRRVGVQATGAYWGGAGEQIDLISGNLNFSVPLVTAKGRGGWSVTFRLSYNSQMWRRDPNGEWLFGQDVGYGLGWKLLAGAVTPIWSEGQIAYYLFTDASGAEYRLDRNTGNVWTSVQGIYVAYNANNNRLQFPDGTFWTMGCQSSGGETDAGTLYPTQMQDTNGNYLKVDYAWGAGSGGANTSARITGIHDSRSTWGSPVFQFQYSQQNGHLTAITNVIYTPETYTFTHLSGQPLVSPFTSTSFGSTTVLQSVSTTGLGIATNFQYANTGEMTQMTTPLGGVLQWSYRGFTYGTGIAVREVLNRTMPMYAAGHGFWHDDAADATQPFHGITVVYDSTGQKPWWFGTSPVPSLVVPYWQTERPPDYSLDYFLRTFGWALDAVGNVYTNSSTTYVNPNTPPSGYGSTSWPHTTTTQVLDTHGSLVQQQVYDYGAASPTRTYNFTYLTDANYTSRHIFNRMTSATVTDASGAVKGLVSNTYDQWGTAVQYNVGMHDSANYGTGFNFRGNLTKRHTADGADTFWYLMTGVLQSTTNAAGVSVGNSTSGATNYSLPEVITPGGSSNLATSIGYNSSWAVTSVTGANGANSTTSYDSYGRPSSSKIPDGAITNYTYTYNPNTQTATLGSRWTKTTLDGFGRPIKVETGNGGTTVSVAETEYAPCACSPLGKLKRTARPHAPGATPQWTTYTYDGMGRTTAVTLPDGSVTTTAYSANSVKVTDAAGKWKKQTTDAMGNLVLVTEPNPAGGEWTTTYQYNVVNQLTRVEMPRPHTQGTYTQVRTFAYNQVFLPGFISFTFMGSRMTSETNPETGTITYQYDGNGRMSARIDAKNQKREYSYDQYGRLTQKRYLYWKMQDGWMQWVEDGGQRVDFRFDTNMPGESYSQNAWGRLTAVEFKNSNPNTFEQFGYRYSYNQAGRVTNQRMRITPRANQQGVATPVELDASYGWDNEGRMTTQTGPSNGLTETFAYDAMGRLSNNGATYGPAGELLTFNGVTRTYNVLGQLTRMTKAGVMDMEYRYTAGQNNGRIWQSKDYVTGEEVTYQYDALNRLTAASTTDNAWGNAYTYDGWGNLKSKSVTKGTAPSLSVSYDPALNMETGSNPPSYVPWDYTLKWDSEDRPREGKAQVWAPWPPYSTGTVTYDHTGKKVFWAGGSYNPSPWEEFAACEVYFYGITGKKLARYQCRYEANNENGDGGNFGMWVADRTQHIGGQLTRWNGPVDWMSGQFTGGAATTDRLGSLRARDAERYTYFPYGETRTETVAGGGVYAGLESPLRNYDSGKGRFGTPDPLGLGAVKMGDPGSWNRFAYVQGDPVNYYDPEGLQARRPCEFASQYNYGAEGWSYAGYDLYVCYEEQAVGGGSSTGPPKEVPQLGDATGAQQKTFKKAFENAEKRLKKKPCLDLIGSEAVAKMADASWSFGLILDDESPTGFLPGTVQAAADPKNQSVQINMLGGFFTPLQTLNGIQLDFLGEIRQLIPNANDNDLRAFIMLHEVAHLTGKLGADRGDKALSDAFNRSIAEKCF
jgi:RHS repeat-associated protein